MTPPTSAPSASSAKVAWNFTQTLMKKVAELAEPNPVKLVFGIAKAIIEIKDVSTNYREGYQRYLPLWQIVKDNMDTTERRIVSIGAQLEIVTKAVDGWTVKGSAERACVERFRKYVSSDLESSWLMDHVGRVLEEELDKLTQMSKEWVLRKVADHESEKGEILLIFERVNEARVQLGVRLAYIYIYSVSPRLTPMIKMEVDLRVLSVVQAVDKHTKVRSSSIMMLYCLVNYRRAHRTLFCNDCGRQIWPTTVTNLKARKRDNSGGSSAHLARGSSS